MEKIMLIWLIIIAGVVFLDQLTKWLTVINLDLRESITVIDGFFSFTYVQNKGAAFSMLSNHRWVFMTISTVAIVALSIYLWKKRKDSKLLGVALSFIIGGGIGNMVDRTILGYVIDFLDFIIGRDANGHPIHFAIFNIADTFVCVGVGLFALYIILDEFKQYKKEKAAKVKINVKNNICELENENEANIDINVENSSVNANDNAENDNTAD
jgi:signal peptidase II